MIKNHELRTHNDKMCADNSTGNTLNTPQFVLSTCPKRNNLGYFGKKTRLVSIVHASSYSKSVKLLQTLK